MADSVMLLAECLWSKHGFGDGDCLDDLLWDLDIDPMQEVREGSEDEQFLCHAVLEHLVENKLLPALPTSVEILKNCSRSHNPIRAANWSEGPPIWAADLSVVVSLAELKAAAEDILTRAQA